MAIAIAETGPLPEGRDETGTEKVSEPREILVTEAELFGYGEFEREKPFARGLLEQYHREHPSGSHRYSEASEVVAHDLVVIKRLAAGTTPEPAKAVSQIVDPDAVSAFKANPYDAEYVVELYEPGDEAGRPEGYAARLTHYNARVGMVQIWMPIEPAPPQVLV